MADTHGVKIAPPGEDVFTSTEDKLSFISSRQILKVAGVGLAVGPVTILHNLNYAPAYVCFENYTEEGETRVRTAGGRNNVYMTETALVLPYSNMNYKYYVFYKPAI